MEDELNALAWELMETEGLPLPLALDEAALRLAELRAYARGYEAGQRATIISRYTHALDWDYLAYLAGNAATGTPRAN